MQVRGIGKRIRRGRERRGLTVAELARIVGVDPSAVYHWEAGRFSPASKHMLAVAAACGLEVASLLPRGVA